MEKTTKRAMYTMISEALAENKQVVDFCKHEIELLDKKADKARERAAKKAAAGDALRQTVYDTLSDTDYMSTADIVAAINDPEVTTSKVTYRLTALIKDGLVEKTEGVIEATETSKARKIKVYRKIGD